MCSSDLFPSHDIEATAPGSYNLDNVGEGSNCVSDLILMFNNMMSRPYKNWANASFIPSNFANAGIIATIAKKIDPGKVIRDMISSRYSAVRFPGLIPGINPLLRFISSAI